MKILVVGGGGREHAIIKKLRESKNVEEILCAPGNGGIAELATCCNVSATDIEGMVKLCLNEKVDFAVVAPDDPLSLGMVDALESAGIKAFGPTKAAARIEGSKVFAKELMERAGIKTAYSASFTDIDEAKAYVRSHGAPIVIKADGLAKGKGVVVAATESEALEAVDMMMNDRVFGSAGSTVLIEEFLNGVEMSVMCFCDGKTVKTMLSSQDHKRLLDGDRGANTGGMGAFSPSPLCTDALMNEMMNEILYPAAREMESLGCPFRGVLYAGVMLTQKGTYVLEFNSRFGDPETQVVLPLLKSDLLEIMLACRNGNLNETAVEFENAACAAVVLASGGYPGSYPVGREIVGLNAFNGCTDAWVIHAGTMKDGDRLLTSGGRVLCVCAKGNTVKDAVDRAYSHISDISFEGAFYRKDIGRNGAR